MEYGQVHHIEYYVEDLAVSRAFWDWFAPRMGYGTVQPFGDGVSYIHANGTYLVFVQVKPAHLAAGNTRQGNGLNHLAFCGGTAASVSALASDVEERGALILKNEDGCLCFEDPNGFAIEVFDAPAGPG